MAVNFNVSSTAGSISFGMPLGITNERSGNRVGNKIFVRYMKITGTATPNNSAGIRLIFYT